MLCLPPTLSLPTPFASRQHGRADHRSCRRYRGLRAGRLRASLLAPRDRRPQREQGQEPAHGVEHMVYDALSSLSLTCAD